MKKFVFIWAVFLLILSVVVFISFKNEDAVEIDVRDSGFEYDVAICDRYFELVECIIDRDTNVNYTKEMRDELKNLVKDLQNEWKHLNKEELTKECIQRLGSFEKDLEENKLDSFGCFTGI